MRGYIYHCGKLGEDRTIYCVCNRELCEIFVRGYRYHCEDLEKIGQYTVPVIENSVKSL